MGTFFNLKMFDDGENQNQNIRYYGKQLLGILRAVFAVKSYWSDFFTPLQLLDGKAPRCARTVSGFLDAGKDLISLFLQNSFPVIPVHGNPFKLGMSENHRIVIAC